MTDMASIHSSAYPDRMSAGSDGDVTIILSTFNGGRFLPEQLESFRKQDGVDWRLIWRDDGSTDATNTIMDDFCLQLPAAQAVRATGSGVNLGVFNSFMTLLGDALDAPAVAFADQDDVWLPEKLQRALARLRTVEPGRPAVYCARQMLVDEALQPIGLSPLPHHAPGFPGLLLQNIGTGCTIVMNRAAAQAIHASQKPQRSLHDWWSCLFVAAIGGTILFDDTTPAILYRQHGANLVGASKSRLRRLVGALSRGAGAHNAQLSGHLDALMRNNERLTPEAARITQQIRTGYGRGWSARLALFRIAGFRRQTMMENVLLGLWLLRGHVPSGSYLKRMLKNKSTLFVYEKLRCLLQQVIIFKDRQIFRLRRMPLPEVRCVKAAAACAQYDRMAILVIFSERLDNNHHRAIQGLARAGYAVALANNRSFAAGQAYPDGVTVAIENRNVGRDVGAYLRGLRYVQAQRILAPDARVMFLNDSVIFLPGHETVFMAFAAQRDDWVGMTESHRPTYHVTSWCFELSAALIGGEGFRQWSTSFMPLNNRVHLINEGEIGLSRALLDAGHKPKILYDSTFWGRLQEAASGREGCPSRIIPRQLRGMDQRQSARDSVVQRANQTHLFTFGGVFSDQFPFVKKDLLYRNVFDEDDLDVLCDGIAQRHGAMIADECRTFLFRRGNGGGLRGVARLRWMLGLD
jgi:glycosyltransferase involved in cell wall biosynthesis